jgi:glycosyltransferase involved in cell wall biosynthesis
MSEAPTEGAVTFSVIVPTRGRRSLRGTLDSIVDQGLQPGDEILVLCNNDGDFGNRARQSLLERASGTHLLFMDDDDQFALGAFDAMRQFAREQPDRVGIFRMRHLDGRVLWRDPVLRRGNISTQMFCVPNIPGRLGSWVEAASERPEGRDYVGDYNFITSTIATQGDPVFRDVVVAHNRSDRRAFARIGNRITAGARALQRRVRAFRTSD